jgi:hypothetical protein
VWSGNENSCHPRVANLRNGAGDRGPPVWEAKVVEVCAGLVCLKIEGSPWDIVDGWWDGGRYLSIIEA